MSEGPSRDPLHKPSDRKQSNKEEAKRFLESELAKMQAKAAGLEKDNAALIAEYVTASDEEAPAKVKKNIRARMPKAFMVVDELLEHGNDGVRAMLAKWIITSGINPDALGGIDAEAAKLTELLAKLAD